MQGQSEDEYFHAMHMATVEAKTVTADFEMAMLNSIRMEFPNAPVVGC